MDYGYRVSGRDIFRCHNHYKQNDCNLHEILRLLLESSNKTTTQNKFFTQKQLTMNNLKQTEQK